MSKADRRFSAESIKQTPGPSEPELRSPRGLVRPRDKIGMIKAKKPAREARRLTILTMRLSGGHSDQGLRRTGIKVDRFLLLLCSP